MVIIRSNISSPMGSSELIEVKNQLNKVTSSIAGLSATVASLARLPEMIENLSMMVANLQKEDRTVRPCSSEDGRSRRAIEDGEFPDQREIKIWKIELSNFSGEDPQEWLHTAERYFSLCNISEADRVRSVSFCMKEAAWYWFVWLEKYVGLPSWSDFKAQLLQRFGPSLSKIRLDFLCSLQQDTTVEDYRHRFEFFSAHIKNVSDEWLQCIFRDGLKDTIRGELELYEIVNLQELMKVSRKIEERNNWLVEGPIRNPSFPFCKDQSGLVSGEGRNHSVETFVSKASPVLGPRFTGSLTPLTDITNLVSSTVVSAYSVKFAADSVSLVFPNVKNFSEAAVYRRRTWGMYFRYGENWSQAHRCWNKGLQFLIREDVIVSGLATPITMIDRHHSRLLGFWVTKRRWRLRVFDRRKKGRRKRIRYKNRKMKNDPYRPHGMRGLGKIFLQKRTISSSITPSTFYSSVRSSATSYSHSCWRILLCSSSSSQLAKQFKKGLKIRWSES